MQINRSTKLNVAALALLSVILLQPLSLLGQGSLTPPGGPAPTMVTLGQIEPRTPISSIPFTISQPGAYYLTTNLTATTANPTGITITTNGVTLDMRDFIINSIAAPANGYGIRVLSSLSNRPQADFTLLRGHITSPADGVNGFVDGIDYYTVGSGAPLNVLVSQVTVSGVTGSGINLGNGSSGSSGSVVENCAVNQVGSYGIVASAVRGSLATSCGGTAIYADQVSDCRDPVAAAGLASTPSAPPRTVMASALAEA